MEKESKNTLTTSLVFLLAVTCGVIVANMYYVQPVGTDVAATFHVSTSLIGLISMLTQLGYALGLLFLVPLGDVVDRKKLIIWMCILSSFSLLCAFLSPTFLLFAISSFLIGILSIVPQIIIPYGAVLAGPHERGHVMGLLLSGLLCGILLSRTISGLVASILPWKTIYLLALVLIFFLTLTLHYKMPNIKQTTGTKKMTYTQTLKTIPHLIRSQKILRESAINGFFMFGTFSIFWSTLIFYISSPAYHWGTFEAGLLAILGLAGAIAAPIVGRLSDNYSDRHIILMGLAMETASFLLLFFGGSHLICLILAIILLDVGNQFGQVCNQTRVQNLGIETSSRNNTVFMFSYFIGGSFGSLIGTMMWQVAGWTGVTLSGLAFQLVAYLFFFFYHNKKESIAGN